MDKLRRSLYRKKRNVIKDAYCFLDINDIVANKEQPRTHFEDEKIQELAESIMQNGLLQPIVVREYEGKYQIVVGERRYRACKLAGITEVPCIIQELDDNQTANAALVENIQRENLTAIELAWAYKGIIDNLDIRQEDLAQKIGKSRSHVTNTLGLLNLPKSVQEMILNGDISMGHARVLSKMDDDDEVIKLADRIVHENISVHELEDISKKDDKKNAYK